MICVVCIYLLKNIPFKTDPATKQLAKQLIIQGAMEQDTENETENEELPGIFFPFIIHTSLEILKSITNMRGT